MKTSAENLFRPFAADLKSLATELQDMVQAKAGVTKFSQVYNQIRQGAQGTRQERRVARVMRNTTDPEAAAKRKMRRSEAKKDNRKRKIQVFAFVFSSD